MKVATVLLLVACSIAAVSCGNPSPIKPYDSINTPEPTKTCKPGTTKKVDCNTCSCNERGNWICTQMACPKPTKVMTTVRPKLCTPGTNKKIDCNNCFCTGDGQWACTKMLCPKTTTAPTTKKPLVCGANEVREECYNPCPSDKCADIGKLQKCVVIEEKDCKPGCRCALHFRRNSAGVCIDTRKCPAPRQCKSGEFWDNNCSVNIRCNDERCIREPGIYCIMMVPPECIPRCQCKDKHCRNEGGTCIKKGCNGDPNAVSVKCGDPCPVTCRNKDVHPREPCDLPCDENGCRCVSGYVLDDEGVCIPELECPEICVNPNEEFQKCRADQYCTGIFAGGEVVLPKPDVCKPNCRCNEGYVRDYNNICIRPEECCKEPNTEMVSCPNPCPGGTCLEPEFEPCKRACQPFGCQCREGFVKTNSTDATCIALHECPENYAGKYCDPIGD